jgi:hypothetical protein
MTPFRSGVKQQVPPLRFASVGMTKDRVGWRSERGKTKPQILSTALRISCRVELGRVACAPLQKDSWRKRAIAAKPHKKPGAAQ